MFMVAALTLPGAAHADGGAARRTTRTDRASHAGWNDFTWGMKRTTVAALLRDPKGAYRARSSLDCRPLGHFRGLLYCDFPSEKAHELHIFGMAPALTFQFADDRLSEVTLDFEPVPSLHETFEAAIRALTDKYGTHDYDSGRDNRESRMVSWSLPHVEIECFMFNGFDDKIGKHRTTLHIGYRDPEFVHFLGQRSRDRLKEGADRL
jgi:hypothetical protein